MTSRQALAFIFITFMLDTIGLGIIIPVQPGLIAELTREPISAAAAWGGWLFFVYALMQFLCAPLIGNLSDRFGRRPVLIGSLLMMGVAIISSPGFPPPSPGCSSALGTVGGPTLNAILSHKVPRRARPANWAHCCCSPCHRRDRRGILEMGAGA